MTIERVRVPLTCVLGRTELTVADLAGVGPGTIIEFDTYAGEPVELMAAGRRVAVGEVVVIDEKFGLRITAVETESD